MQLLVEFALHLEALVLHLVDPLLQQLHLLFEASFNAFSLILPTLVHHLLDLDFLDIELCLGVELDEKVAHCRVRTPFSNQVWDTEKFFDLIIHTLVKFLTQLLPYPSRFLIHLRSESDGFFGKHLSTTVTDF